MRTSSPVMILLSLLLFASLFTAQTRQQQARDLFPVEKDGKYGFIDRQGKIVIPIQFDGVNEFHEGLALVTAGKKKMFIDATAKVVINPQFDIVDDFSEGVAAVNIGQTRIPNIGLISNPGKWGYIDTTGKLVMPLRFTHAEDFNEGLAAITDGDRDHGAFIDHSGKPIFTLPLDVTLGLRLVNTILIQHLACLQRQR